MAMNPELAQAIVASAGRLGVDPVDLGTAISYETAGSFEPWKAGPTTQWGQHRGLIQWGEPQAKQYGVTKDTSVSDQMLAVEQYLKDRGLKPGAGMLDLYSTINAGSPGRYNASDAANGGAPGTVLDKVRSQMAGHRDNAQRLLGGAAAPNTTPSPGPAPAGIGRSPPAAAPASPAAPDDDLMAQLQAIPQLLQQKAQAVQYAPIPQIPSNTRHRMAMIRAAMGEQG